MAIDNAIILQAQAGNLQAQDNLIKEHLAFIKTLVGKLPHLDQNYYDDLVQEGCLGLLRALTKFDPNKGTEFLTYATPWIKKYISDGMGTFYHHIKFSVSEKNHYIKVHNFIDDYFKSIGDFPTAEEISENINLPLDKVQKILQYPTVQLFSATAVNNNDDNEVTILDSLADDDNTQEWASKEDLKNSIHLALSILDERSRKVISLVFGLEGETSHTYEEVGQTLNLSRQRVEQIIKMAKTKIKESPDISVRLQSFCLS